MVDQTYGNSTESPKLVYDVFSVIVKMLNKKDALSFSLTSSYYTSFLKTYTSKGMYAGITRLYDRQSDALRWIFQKYKNGISKLFCCAYMSFGKTLLGLAVAKKYITADGVVVILVPGNVIKVWQREYTKHFRVPKSIEKRHILFWNIPEQRKVIISNPYGKIVVASPNCTAMKNKKFTDPLLKVVIKSGLVIVDEVHRNEETITVLPKEMPNAKFLYLGASFRDNLPKEIEIYKGFAKDVMPKFSIDFKIYNERNIVSEIQNSKYKYQVVMLDYEKSRLVNENYGNTPVYKYMKHNVTAFKKHQLNGGVLLSTIRKIAEGENINRCEVMHLIAEDGVSLQRYQQAIGRVVRQSSEFGKIRIHIHVREELSSYTVGRLVLMDMPWMGYEINSSVNKLRYLKMISDEKKEDYDHGEMVKINLDGLVQIREKFTWPEKLLLFSKKVNCSAEGPLLKVRPENMELIFNASIL